MKNNLAPHSEKNPHPTAVIREVRYLIRNAIAFYTPIASWCLQNGLVKESASVGGTKYEITETGLKYIEQYRDYDPEPV